jgi:hypothetical protein
MDELGPSMRKVNAILRRPAPKRNKFNAKKTVVDGITFDSKREAQVYGELKLREKAGEIYDLTIHPKYELDVLGTVICRYTADFCFYESAPPNEFRVVDVKSPPTAKKRDFVMTRKLMRACYGIDVEVIA